MKDKIREHYNRLAIEFHHAYILGNDDYCMYLSAMIDTHVRECKLFEFEDVLSDIADELDLIKECMGSIL